MKTWMVTVMIIVVTLLGQHWLAAYILKSEIRRQLFELCCWDIRKPTNEQTNVMDVIAKMSHLILFADDTNIFVADHNLNNLICNIYYELQVISEWLNGFKLINCL